MKTAVPPALDYTSQTGVSIKFHPLQLRWSGPVRLETLFHHAAAKSSLDTDGC